MEIENDEMELKSSKGNLANMYPNKSVGGVNRPFRRSPANMDSQELDKYLSAFVLIKTPYGYALGRKNSGMPETSIARRSVRSGYPHKNV